MAHKHEIIAEIVSLGDKNLNRKISDAIEKYTDCIKNPLSEAVIKL